MHRFVQRCAGQRGMARHQQRRVDEQTLRHMLTQGGLAGECGDSHPRQRPGAGDVEGGLVLARGLNMQHQRGGGGQHLVDRSAAQGRALHRITALHLRPESQQRLQQCRPGLLGSQLGIGLDLRPRQCCRHPGQVVVGGREQGLIGGFVLGLFGVGQHPGHTGQLAGLVSAVGQKVAGVVDMHAAELRHPQRREQGLNQGPAGAGLLTAKRRCQGHEFVFAVSVSGYLRARRGLQDLLGLQQITGFHQRHLGAGHRPHRPQHGQHLANAGLYRRLGRAVVGALKLPANHRQYTVGLLGHAQQRQRAGRAQMGHGIAAQRVQRGGLQQPRVFVGAVGVPQLHQIVAEGAAPQRIHHVQRGALLGQVGVGQVVGRQAIGRQAQRMHQQLQRVFLGRQQRGLSGAGRGHTLIGAVVAGRRRLGVVGGCAQRHKGQAL